MARDFAMATQAQLGKNLMAALQRGGTQEAIPFCNIRALPLTDSMAVVAKARIQRVTNKARNPLNKANAFEVSLIEEYEERLSKKQPLQAKMSPDASNKTYYFPIKTNAMCLQCHGKPGVEVQDATLQNLKKYYPQDNALGYGANEVRGLWKVILEPGS